MPFSCYSLALCLFINVCVYFYFGASVVLIVFIIILFIFWIAVENRFRKIVNNRSGFSKINYQKQRSNMSNPKNNLNTPERKKTILGSGLLCDYDSRLGRKRFSLNSISPLSEKFNSRSPSRSNFKVTKQLLSDENVPSRNSVSFANSDMPSPIRCSVSPFRTMPLSYSKRFNVNEQPGLLNSPSNQNVSRASVQENNSSSKFLGSPPSEDHPFYAAERMISTSNKMDSDQFPWVAHNGTIPLILSSPLKPSSPAPVLKSNSPSSANSSFRNRVRVKLSKPDSSNSSLINSTIDNSSNLDESSTTKSVIQVLKEIARKRCLVTEEDHQHEGPPLAKRRTEHNLYLSRLEGGEEEASPALLTRSSTEDERMKRSRDPDWDTLNTSHPKRPRKNYNFVNNEIISSLSSSIGLHAFKQSGRKRSAKKSIAIQVQTLVPEKQNEERKERLMQPFENSKSPPKTRDTGVVTDPLPEPRPRSPVKEKVISDVNVILKSALSKFDIQPCESKTVGSTSLPLSSSAPIIPPQSTLVADLPPATFTPFSSSNAAVTSTAEITTSSSFSLATPNTSFALASSPSPFTIPSSTSPISFGMPSSDKSSENSKPVEKEEKSIKGNQEPEGLKLENKDISKTESPFKFGVSQTNSPEKLPSSSQSQITSNLFNFKTPETPSSIQAPVSSTPVFNFGAPKISESNEKVLEEPKNLFGSSSSTTVASLSTSGTSVFSQKTESNPSTGIAVSSTQQSVVPMSTSTFNSPSKTSDQVTSSAGAPTSIFSFGKADSKVASENKKPMESKPFQFGSVGLTFSSTNDKNSGGISNSSILQPVSTSSVSTSAFTFSSNSTNSQKNSGFAFSATTTASNEPKNLFTFNSSTPSTTAPTPSGFSSTTSAKPTFPTSLFGSGSANNSLSSPAVTTSITIASNLNTAPTFSSVSSSSNPTFGMSAATTSTPVFGAISTATTTTSFGDTSAAKPVFASTSNPPSFGSTLNNTPVFGNNIKENQNKPTVFGSNTTSTANSTAFGVGSSTPSNISTFGSVASGNTSTSAFGNTAAVTNPTVFGSSNVAAASPTPFGGSAINKNAQSFGSGAGSSFSITTTSSTTPSLFSTSSAGTSTPAFGGTGTNNPSPFGTTASFGNNSTSTFGASSSAFGSGTLTTPNFGNQPQQGFSGQSGTSFGTGSTFGQTSSTPAFGAQSTFGSTSTSTPAFGNPSSTTAFGSTPNFASTPAFGSSANSFGSSSGTTATPAFGTSGTPSFGSSTAFGTQDTANKPFTFNAPASQPPAPGTFNFTAPQPQQGSSSGLFQFGGASTSAPSNQPFQFNASQSSTPVANTGQQMFSIGSGSTAPRRMTARRKK